MTDPSPDELPESMSLHATSDAFEVALFKLMLEYFGEDVGGKRSINSNDAIVPLLRVAGRLMAALNQKTTREICRSLEQGTRDLRQRLQREYAERAARPQQ